MLVTLLAAISWMFSKEAVQLMPPLLFMSVRFILAGAVLASVSYKQLHALSGADWLRSTRVGLVFGVAMCFWVTGLAAASHVGEAAFLVSLGVVMVPIIARVLFREAIPNSTWFALPVAVAGLAFLSLGAPAETTDGNALEIETAHILLFISAVIFALYFNLNTRAANTASSVLADGNRSERARVPVLALTTIVLAVVGLVTGLASALLEPWVQTLTRFNGELLWWVLLSATVGTALRFLIQTYAQSLAANSHGIVIMVLEPLWTALIAAAWFSESMSPSQLIGCVLVFLSLLVNRFKVIVRFFRTRR